jgi:hypothetical protein
MRVRLAPNSLAVHPMPIQRPTVRDLAPTEFDAVDKLVMNCASASQDEVELWQTNDCVIMSVRLGPNSLASIRLPSTRCQSSAPRLVV